MAETHPAGESPRSDWEIGKAMNGLFGGPADDGLAADAAPDEDQAADDEVVDEIDAPDGESEDQDAETPSKAEPYMVVTVNGQDIVIGSKEEAMPLARQGLHYTQEMQKLRDEQRRWEADREHERQRIRHQENEYAQVLKSLESTYGYVLGKESPDWNSNDMQNLRTQSPDQYMAMRDQWDQLSSIRSELARLEYERRAEADKSFQVWVSDQQEALKSKAPEWADASRRQQDHAMIRDYANVMGITEQELGGMYDHRIWLVLRDAARYRQAETAGKQKRTSATQSKTVEPGSGKNVNQGNRALKNERERLRQTGDVRAAGNILQELMTNRR
jgi:hypothetical protein